MTSIAKDRTLVQVRLKAGKIMHMTDLLNLWEGAMSTVLGIDKEEINDTMCHAKKYHDWNKQFCEFLRIEIDPEDFREFEISEELREKLKKLSGPHRHTIYKMMLAQREINCDI